MWGKRIACFSKSLVTVCAVASLLLVFGEIPCDGKEPGKAIEEPHEGIIVAFGDSLTRGYGLSEQDAFPAQLERKLRQEGYSYRVINAGIDGETSSEALSRIDRILNIEPDIVILETGANDGFRGIRTDIIEENIREIIRALKKHNIIVILAGMQMPSSLGGEYTGSFKGIYTRTADEEDLVLIPFFLDGVAARPALNHSDGIHPTAEGYLIVTENVYPYVIEAIKRAEALRNHTVKPKK